MLQQAEKLEGVVVAYWLFVPPCALDVFLPWLAKMKQEWDAAANAARASKRPKLAATQQEAAAAGGGVGQAGGSRNATDSVAPEAVLGSMGKWVIPVEVMRQAAARFGTQGVYIKEQRHGEVMVVPPATPHAVTTVHLSIKLATDVIRPCNLPLYALAHATHAVKYFHNGEEHLVKGSYTGEDYTCWLRVCMNMALDRSCLSPLAMCNMFERSR